MIHSTDNMKGSKALSCYPDIDEDMKKAFLSLLD